MENRYGLRVSLIKRNQAKSLITRFFFVHKDWFVQFELYGGKNSAIMSVPQDATAFSQRSILWTMHVG